MRRALSSAILFSSIPACPANRSSIFSLVRSIPPWVRVKEPLATGGCGLGGSRLQGTGVGQWELPDLLAVSDRPETAATRREPAMPYLPSYHPWLAAQSWDVRGCGRAQDARESGMLGLDTKSPAFRLSFPVCCLSVKSGGGEPARQQDAMPRPHHLSIDRHLNTTRLWVCLVAQSWDVRGCGRAQDARESGMLGLDKKSPAFQLSFPGGGRNRSMRVRRRPARRLGRHAKTP